MHVVSVMKFENYIVDFLMCPTAQDSFTSDKLRTKLCEWRQEIDNAQVEDVIQILYKAINELEFFRLWKMGKMYVMHVTLIVRNCCVTYFIIIFLSGNWCF